VKRHLFFSMAHLFLVTTLVIGCSGQPTPVAPEAGLTATTPQPLANKTNEPPTPTVPPVEPTAPQPENNDSSEPQTPIVSHGGSVADYVSLIDNLRAAGTTVEPKGEVSQAFFSVKGQVISVNGGEVQVFEYADESAAEADAALISPDGGSIGTTMVTWVAAPHFYKIGKLIVLYVGNDSAVIKVLESVLGPQFAGR
jgi:hypothetical protein